MQILNSYPLLEFIKDENDDPSSGGSTKKKRILKTKKPEVILSESFSA